MTTIDRPAARPVPTAARSTAVRLHLLGRSAGLMLTAMLGVPLFVLWVTLVALSPITLVAPLVLPVTAAVRAYANAHRASAGRLLGAAVEPSYRASGRPNVLRRIWDVERDPASWRDAAWLLLHAVVAFVAATVAVALFLSAIFYLAYPFLFWVTPQPVFGRPFGGWLSFHSVADASIMMALAPLSFGLWWLLQIPLTRAELRLTGALLGRRSARATVGEWKAQTTSPPA